MPGLCQAPTRFWELRELKEVDFEDIFTTFSQGLTMVAYSVVKNWYTAEDIVQEAFMKAYNKIDSIENRDKLGPWLRSITLRTAIDFLRAEKRRNVVCSDHSFIDYVQFHLKTEASPEEEVEILLLKEEIEKNLLVLSDDFQQVLSLRVQYGLKESEIASLLKLKPTTVKTRLHRARKQLKNVMKEKYSA